ncbi:hypothetical protein [Paraliobacillus sediminis]|uniref:hypothetical protein n=1 Tax=Paraliobacillus sediminis TaxID=1885916 RepID=UPI000E3CC1F5|nr:hypothetical protein [Paraliobacillus sediminis]
MERNLELKINQLSKNKREKIDLLFKNYDIAMKGNNQNKKHESTKELAEAVHQVRYGRFMVPANQKGSWIDRVKKIMKGGE